MNTENDFDCARGFREEAKHTPTPGTRFCGNHGGPNPVCAECFETIGVLLVAAELAQEYLSEINYEGAITPTSFALTKEKLRNAIAQAEGKS